MGSRLKFTWGITNISKVFMGIAKHLIYPSTFMWSTVEEGSYGTHDMWILSKLQVGVSFLYRSPILNVLWVDLGRFTSSQSHWMPFKFHTSCEMMDTHNHKYEAICFGWKVNCHDSYQGFGLMKFFMKVWKLMNLTFEDQTSEAPFIHKYRNQCKGHVRNATHCSEYVLAHTRL